MADTRKCLWCGIGLMIYDEASGLYRCNKCGNQENAPMNKNSGNTYDQQPTNE